MFNLSFQNTQNTHVPLMLAPGDILFVLGANGTGKSSLMLHFYRQNVNSSKQISAHRQTWFQSGSSTLSPHERKNSETHIQNQDVNSQARWMDHYSSQKANIAIYDLVDVENTRARTITQAFENGRLAEAQMLLQKESPISSINDLLAASNIPIKISIQEGAQIVASKRNGPEYSIAELSDGERNALLIAANVLTTKPNNLILVDEPERHLHRSIIAPLLTHLFAKRPDCAFVVSTHDVMLPLDNPTSQTLLVRGCNYSGQWVTGWDADMLGADDVIGDDLKEDVLGSRRKIIFVEGNEQSLDKPLYSVIFPFVSIIPKSSCHEVERAVAGIRDVHGFHWLTAWGVVDNDRRTASDIENLKEKGVYALPVFSVESIFYHPTLQRFAAEKQVALTGGDSQQMLDDAKRAAINAITPHIGRLSERAVEKALRDEMFKHLPRRRQIAARAQINVQIDVEQFVQNEHNRFSTLLGQGDLQTIISSYPVRETPALDQIVERLGFRSRIQYEGAVRKILMENPEALALVRSMFAGLFEETSAVQTVEN